VAAHDTDSGDEDGNQHLDLDHAELFARRNAYRKHERRRLDPPNATRADLPNQQVWWHCCPQLSRASGEGGQLTFRTSDPKIKRRSGGHYKRAWDEQVAPRYRSGEPAPGTSRERFERMLAAAENLANHIHEAPVWIVPCLEGATPTRTSGSSIYPAVQNMLLAARALGLGATLTTLHALPEFREGSGGRTRIAARRPLVCLTADRLPDGPVWAIPPYPPSRCRLRRAVGPAL
jgi:hypothetical protein